ncbi:MAG: hypothetical protein U0587_15955 [Candidatus Binatia bacterium]
MRWYASVGMSIVVATVAAHAAAAGQTQRVKDPDGNTLAVVLSCDTCKTGSAAKGAHCAAGAEDGWLDGQPCGKCLIAANAQQPLAFGYDIHIVGKLVDGEGNPLKERFVKMFTTAGWSMRSRTADDGSFHFIMGATAERKSQSPVLTDIGSYVDTAKGTPYYAFFLLPDAYQQCPAVPAAAAPKKPARNAH